MTAARGERSRAEAREERAIAMQNASKRRRDRCFQAMEDILSFLRKGKETQGTMEELKTRFLAPSPALETTVHELTKISLTEAEAQLFSMIPGLCRFMLRSALGDSPRLCSQLAAADYLRTLFIGLPIERFYALGLDENGRLIDCRMLQSGTVDETPFYLGNLLQYVVSTGAAAVVLSHNHPGGTTRPSQADVDCTLEALRALEPLEVVLLDHIIIADGRAVTLRNSDFMDQKAWEKQMNSMPLYDHWMDLEDDD